jgi:hypothetical protein
MSVVRPDAAMVGVDDYYVDRGSRREVDQPWRDRTGLRAGVMTCRRITTPVTPLYTADWALPSSDRHSTCQPTGQP